MVDVLIVDEEGVSFNDATFLPVAAQARTGTLSGCCRVKENYAEYI